MNDKKSDSIIDDLQGIFKHLDELDKRVKELEQKNV